MAIPEFTKSLTVRLPDDVRFQLESLSNQEQKPLSKVVRAVLAAGLEQKMASRMDLVELEA